MEALKKNFSQDLIDDEVDRIVRLNAEAAEIKKQKAKAEDALKAYISSDISEALADNDYGCGTANIETDKYKIKAVVSKKVDWDQDALKTVYAKILKSGQDPSEYMDMVLKVSETKFKSWPSNIQSEFVAARTVEPSAPKFTFEERE